MSEFKTAKMLGIRFALGKVYDLEKDSNQGYTDAYKRGWADALSVLEKQFKAEMERLDPKPIG